ncbi:hypothetical protein KJA16_01330 [Patescibacteria group bacterium]|nr:hypothetical protein [Patescibacteria group bacterium]
MSFSKYLKRIQNLPLAKRKIIFWAIIITFGLILFAFYIINIQKKIKNFPTEKSLKELKLPELQEELKKLPKFEVEEEIKEFKENIGEIERLIEETEKKEK